MIGVSLPQPCPKCGADVMNYSGWCGECGYRPPAPGMAEAPDDTEGRKLYRAKAESLARADAALASRRVSMADATPEALELARQVLLEDKRGDRIWDDAKSIAIALDAFASQVRTAAIAPLAAGLNEALDLMEGMLMGAAILRGERGTIKIEPTPEMIRLRAIARPTGEKS